MILGHTTTMAEALVAFRGEPSMGPTAEPVLATVQDDLSRTEDCPGLPRITQYGGSSPE